MKKKFIEVGANNQLIENLTKGLRVQHEELSREILQALLLLTESCEDWRELYQNAQTISYLEGMKKMNYEDRTLQLVD